MNYYKNSNNHMKLCSNENYKNKQNQLSLWKGTQ